MDLLDAIFGVVRTYYLGKALVEDPAGCLRPVIVVVAWGILATVLLLVIVLVIEPMTGLGDGLWPFAVWLGMVVVGPLWTTYRLGHRP